MATNKKGVSVIVAVLLLFIVAVATAVITYSYLTAQQHAPEQNQTGEVLTSYEYAKAYISTDHVIMDKYFVPPSGYPVFINNTSVLELTSAPQSPAKYIFVLENDTTVEVSLHEFLNATVGSIYQKPVFDHWQVIEVKYWSNNWTVISRTTYDMPPPYTAHVTLTGGLKWDATADMNHLYTAINPDGYNINIMTGD